MISDSTIDALHKLEQEDKNKQEEFHLPESKISFKRAISTLLNQSEAALNTFMFRFVESLSISHLQTLTRYVNHRNKRLE